MLQYPDNASTYRQASPTSTDPTTCLRPYQVDAGLHGQAEKAQPPEEVANAHIAPLAFILRRVHVTPREEHPVQGPEDAQRGGGDGVAQAGDEDQHEVVGVVLEEVGVSALGRVEAEEALAQVVRVGSVDLLFGGVGVGVGHAGVTAGAGDHNAVPEVHEGGQGASEDDVAATCQIIGWRLGRVGTCQIRRDATEDVQASVSLISGWMFKTYPYSLGSSMVVDILAVEDGDLVWKVEAGGVQ